MKIVHINEYYSCYGGTEKYLFDICKTLEEMGHEIVAVASSEKESIHVKGRKEYLLKGSYGLRSSLKAKKLIKEIIKKENPDILHLHNVQHVISPLILKYLYSIKPVVMTVHDIRVLCPSFRWKVIPGYNEICDHPMGLRCFKNNCYPFLNDKRTLFWNIHKFLLMAYALMILKKMDRLIVPSSYIKEELIRNSFPRESIRVIPHYFDNTAIFTKEEKKESKKTILYVGKLDSIKGCMQFIESLSLLNSDRWRAEIVGEGPAKEEAKQLVERLKLEDRVKFRGKLSVDELNICYTNSSIVVMPSMVPESFGLVGIEAMAFENPVVAFDSGGIKEWLVNNETGFLVKRGNVRELSCKISQLLEDKSLLMKMGRKGKARVEKLYRKDIHIEKLLTVYEEAINRRTDRKTENTEIQKS